MRIETKEHKYSREIETLRCYGAETELYQREYNNKENTITFLVDGEYNNLNCMINFLRSGS